MKVDASDIESAADVEPVGRTDDAFVTKQENLPPSKAIHPTSRATTDLSIALPKGPTVLERVGVGDVVIEKNTRVLYFPEKRQPLLGPNSNNQAEAVQ